MHQEEHTMLIAKLNLKLQCKKSSLWDYSDTYVLVKRKITVDDTSAGGAAVNNTNKKVVFKNCAPFTNCIREINNTQTDNAKDVNIVMPMINLIECSDNYSKTSGSLWQYCKDVPAVDNNDNIVNFNGANGTDSFNFKTKITGQTDDTNVVNQGATFEITETKHYVPVVTLSTQDNTKLLTQLKSGFKRTVTWDKYLSKPELLAQNPNLNLLVEPSFQVVNKLFVLAFENDRQRTSNKRYCIPNVEIKDYNAMIDGRNVFDQPIKNDKITYENIRKIATGQGDDHTKGCLLDYTYFKNYYKMIAIDLSKQQALDADSKAIQQSNFTAN